MRLRAFLNGETREPPDEWVISRICEEFTCLPSHAVRELDHGDVDLLITVMEMRAYARAKQELESAQRQSDVKQTPAILRVLEIELAAMRAESS